MLKTNDNQIIENGQEYYALVYDHTIFNIEKIKLNSKDGICDSYIDSVKINYKNCKTKKNYYKYVYIKNNKPDPLNVFLIYKDKTKAVKMAIKFNNEELDKNLKVQNIIKNKIKEQKNILEKQKEKTT